MTLDYTTLRSSVSLIAVMSDPAQRAASAWKDKAFITATPSIELDSGERVSPEIYLSSGTNAKPKTIFLDINNRTPVATLHNDLATQLGEQQNIKAYSVPRIRSGQEQCPEWLISCGGLVSDSRGELVLFQRTERDPSGKLIAWPSAYNNMMGRCDGLPSQVALKETAEELSILERQTEDGQPVYIPRQIVYEGKTGIPMNEELRLQAAMVRHLKSKGEGLDGKLGETESIAAVPDPLYADRLVTIATRINGEIKDKLSAVTAFSKAERTIEIAVPMQLKPAHENELVYYAREPYGRKTVRLNPEQLMAAHFAWAGGWMGKRYDAQQNRTIHLGGLLPILQVASLNISHPVSRPEEVMIPHEWTDARIAQTLGL